MNQDKNGHPLFVHLRMHTKRLSMDAEPLRMHTERFSMCTEPASGFAPKINYIDSLGVTYGYRSLEELQAENPTHIVHDVEGLIKILSAGSRKTAWRFKPYEACLLS